MPYNILEMTADTSFGGLWTIRVKHASLSKSLYVNVGSWREYRTALAKADAWLKERGLAVVQWPTYSDARTRDGSSLPWKLHVTGAYDRPKVPGFTPLIRLTVERISRSKRNAWRATVLVSDCPMSTSHHDSKEAATSHGATMLRTYAEVHYCQV